MACLRENERVYKMYLLYLKNVSINLVYVYGCLACVFVCTLYVCLLPIEVKRVSDPLGLESEIIGSHEQRVLSLLCSPSF